MRSALAFAGLLISTLHAGPPNIVLILADDLGYGDVGCYNPESKVRTPNLDQLAAEGMRFADAHSPSTVCTPARYSIMTGQMAFRLNYRGVFTGVGGPGLITKDRPTLPGMLRDHGYETAMFGKWHIGMTFPDQAGEAIRGNGLEAVKRIDYSRAIPDAPIHQGFDHYLPDAAPNAPGQLYDLAADPGETNNLYEQHPEIVKELKALLEESKQRRRSAPTRDWSNLNQNVAALRENAG